MVKKEKDRLEIRGFRHGVMMNLLIILVLVCGTIAVFSGKFLGLVFYIVGFGKLSYYKGVVIDMKENTIEEYTTLFLIKWSDKTDLKDYKYILLSEGLLMKKENRESSAYHLYLIPIDKNKTQSILIGKYLKLSDLKKQALELSALLNMEIKSNVG